MSNTLSPELQAKIEQEAQKYESATQHEGLGPALYIDGAGKYALKWEQAEQLIEQMAKALEAIQVKARSGIFPHLPVENVGAAMVIEIDKDCENALADYNNYKNGKDGR
jgi:hypothetical protein